MAGKNTSGKAEHPSRRGQLIKDIAITADDWRWLEEPLGRALALDEKFSITGTLSGFAAMREEYESEDVSAQDIKATLIKISKLPDEEIHYAVSNCDTWTEERLIFALWRMGEKETFIPTDHTPAKWKAAAMLAHAEFPIQRGGAKVKWYREPFARYAFTLWKEMGEQTMQFGSLMGRLHRSLYLLPGCSN
jgi:hypothetical protein